ncbi:MAG TPA: Uma2 family endonuclease [Planctomycetaceae bacterium]|jgi:Uma2 family endonuclease
MSTDTTTRELPARLRKATWDEYVKLRDDDEYRHTRMTYDRGDLELMSPSKLHERVGYLIGRAVDVFTMKRKIAIQSCRTTTFRREDLLRGLEPDNCYYVQNESVVRSRDEVDLTIDPPPDLAIEVDVTRRVINRPAIYAALRVPELWRWHDDRLQILVLRRSGEYAKASKSLALPGFPIDRLVEMIDQRTLFDETTLLRKFEVWCRVPKKS